MNLLPYIPHIILMEDYFSYIHKTQGFILFDYHVFFYDPVVFPGD